MDAEAFERVEVTDEWDTDDELYAQLSEPVERWWRDRFGGVDGSFTRPQRGALPSIAAGLNTLVCAPTGTGKTLSAFAAIIDDFTRRQARDDLAGGIVCLYIAPMRALVNDVHRNLETPLSEIADLAEDDFQPLRHAIRHGDTDRSERRTMREDPPHLLATTPETLAILLNAPTFREHLRSVEYVVVDEIHAMAENKRGVHLAVSLERLENLTSASLVRIGLSATVEPLERAAELLVGRESVEGPVRSCRIIDARGDRPLDLELAVPVSSLRDAPASVISDRLYEQLNALIDEHETTLVFANSRAGAERILNGLRERYPRYGPDRAACHHGSLGASTRERVEDGLKAGTYDVVTTSTSLELGIDMSDVDLVVQLGSAKSVGTFLQRIGRSGHQVGATRRGRLIVTDPSDLFECAAQVDAATRADIESLRWPTAPSDVAIQHIYGMAIAGPVSEAHVFETIVRARPYFPLDQTQFESLLAYLATDSEKLQTRNIYPKIWRDRNDPPGGERHREQFAPDEPILGSRGRLARMIYFTNIGTIPDDFSCQVRTIAEDEWVGELDDAFLDAIDPGDVFVLGGERFAFRYRKGGTIYVEATDASPTVPSWQSERRPTSTHLATCTRAFVARLARVLSDDGPADARRELRRTGSFSEDAVRALVRELHNQLSELGPGGVVTDERICVEEIVDRTANRRRYYVRTRAGGRVNEGLARLLADRARTRTDGPVPVAFGDDGFVLNVARNCRLDISGTLQELAENDIQPQLRQSVRESELFDRYFRINATRSLLVLRQYGDYERTPAEQQFKSDMLRTLVEELPHSPPLEETYRELLEDRFAIDDLEAFLQGIATGAISIAHFDRKHPSPAASGLFNRRRSEGLIVDPDGGTYHEAVPAVQHASER